jgi:hypothetical protein
VVFDIGFHYLHGSFLRSNFLKNALKFKKLHIFGMDGELNYNFGPDLFKY